MIHALTPAFLRSHFPDSHLHRASLWLQTTCRYSKPFRLEYSRTRPFSTSPADTYLFVLVSVLVLRCQTDQSVTDSTRIFHSSPCRCMSGSLASDLVWLKYRLSVHETGWSLSVHASELAFCTWSQYLHWLLQLRIVSSRYAIPFPFLLPFPITLESALQCHAIIVLYQLVRSFLLLLFGSRYRYARRARFRFLPCRIGHKAIPLQVL